MALSPLSSNTAYPNLERLASRRRLVLGSKSPRRVRLLRDAGVPFDQIIPDLEEKRLPGEEPFAYALRLAEDKAKWLMPRLEPDQIVFGCDTIVVLGDRVLEKPADADEALQILSTLSGQPHVVCTAVALADHKKVLTADYETTAVFFNTVTEEQLRNYIASGEPMDKAGAYGIQGMGAFLVDRIEGNLDTVIGLPRTLLEHLSGDVNNMIK